MSTTSETRPRRKPWEEMNPVLPGILAFLIPGTGHLIQGRYFKGLIYLVCIHGAFFTGMCLGEGMTVHNKPMANAQGWRKISLSYAAQFPAGIWAMPAILQARRVDDKANQRAYTLQAPLDASFKGELEGDGPGIVDYQGPVVGTLHLEAQDDGSVHRDVRGEFIGTLNGRPFERKLSGGFEVDRPIGASPGRRLRIRVERLPEDHPELDLVLKGTIPRPIQNWYEVPPDTEQLKEITGRLGKYFELALVFTWIAGLLNILAVWDCVKGPSLGFGDESTASTPAVVSKTSAPVLASAAAANAPETVANVAAKTQGK